MMIKKLLFCFCCLFLIHPVHAKELYIDRYGLGGTCDDSTTYENNSSTSPWCTFDEAFWDGRWHHGFAAGDVIYIRGGTYTDWIRMRPDSLTYNGTSGSPVTIRPYPNETVTIASGGEHCIHVYGGIDYVTIDAQYDNGVLKCFETRRGFKTENDGNTRTGWIIDGLEHDANNVRGKIGIELNDCISPIVRHCTVKNLFQDGEAVGFAVRDGTTNPLFEDCLAENINDGRGKSGDGDGFWGESTSGGENWLDTTITLKRCIVKNVSEDGVDFKATGIVLEDVWVENALTVGVKSWYANPFTWKGGGAIDCGEDGWKGSDTTAFLHNVTLAYNGESGVQARDNPNTVAIKNSIIAFNGISAIDLTDPGAGETTTLNVSYTNLYQPSGYVISTTACPGVNWVSSEITDGTLNTELSAMQSCRDGTLAGSAGTMQSEDPHFTYVTGLPDVMTMSENTSTLTEIDTEVNVDYPWSSDHGIGDEIEIDGDGVLRELTGVGNESDPILTFANDPLSSPVEDGVIIKNWGASPPSSLTQDLTLQGGLSNAINGGVYDASVHCPVAGVSGDCLTWYGTAPDLGYFQFNDNCAIDLEDAIRALQVVSGLEPAGISLEGDVNDDFRIGVAESIHALRK